MNKENSSGDMLFSREQEFLNEKTADENLKDLSHNEVIEYIRSLKQHISALEQQTKQLPESNRIDENSFSVGLLNLSADGHILKFNKNVPLLLGKEPAELHELSLSEFLTKYSGQSFDKFLENLFKKGKLSIELTIRSGEDHKALLIEGKVTEDGENCQLMVFDISKYRERITAHDSIMKLILMCNTKDDFHKCMADLTSALQQWSGCEAVGIRLREGQDYPYFETKGFPQSFVKKENWLCRYGPDGTPELECMCGNILCGRTDPGKSFFTVQGSFWSNDTTKLLATASKEDLQARTRNYCNSVGYESVALIPLRSEGKVFGLLQFNDHRTNCFTPELIEDFERIGEALAFTLLKRKAEKALSKSEQRWSATLSSIGDGVISTDKVGRINFMNQVAEELTGWKKEEAYLKPVKEIFRIINSVTREEEENPAEKVFRSGKPASLTNHTLLIRRDGLEISIDDKGAPIITDEGKIKGVVIVFRDITERKKAQEKLKESEERYRTIIETATEGIWMGTFDRITTYINERMSEMLGFTPDEVIGKDWTHFMDEEAIEISRKNIEKRRKGIKGSYEQKYIRKDGSTLWTLVSATPLLDKQGKVTHTIGMLADITDRKNTEIALKESERRWATTLSSIGDAVIATDNSGNITFLNPVAEKMTGWKSEEAMNLPVKTVFHIVNEQTWEEVESPVEKVIREGTIVGLANHTVLIRKDGSWVPIDDSGAPIRNEEGNVTGVVLVFRDISDRKIAEQHLREKEKQYHNLADSGLALIWTCGKDQLCNYFNEPWLRFRGRTLEQELGKGWTEGVYPEDLQRIQKAHSAAFDNHEKVEMEYRILNANGEYRWIQDLSTPVYDSSGEFQGYIGHCLDITDRINTQEALRASEEKFRTIFENHSAVKMLIDPETCNIIDINQAAADYYGWSIAELKKMKISEINCLEEKEVFEALQKAKSLAKQHFEFCHRRKDGSIRDVEVFSSKIVLSGKDYLHSIVHDITERKKAEERLKLFSASVESASDGILLHDLSGRITYANSSAKRMFGYISDNQIVNLMADSLNGDPEIGQIISGEVMKNNEWRGQTTGLKKSGEKFPVMLSISSILNEKGVPVAFMGVFRDITEQKIAEDKIRESEEKYRSIFEYSNVAMLFTEPHGKIYAANQAACKLFGMTEKELCLSGRKPLVDHQDPRLRKLLHQRQKYGKGSGELTFIKKDGTRFEAEISSTIFIDGEGNKKTSLLIYDLTERKLAEQQIRTLGNAIENGPSSIIITDANGEIEFVNRKFKELTQYTLGDVKGKKPRIFNAGHVEDKEFEELWKTLKKGKIWRGEILERRKDDSYFWEDVTISSLSNQDGSISKYILIMNDITEKKQMLNDLIIAKEKAEESDRLKSAFLANMSHEIRTPMNGILGFAELLKEPKLTGEEQQEYISIIEKSGQRMLNIINDIINISKVESNQMKANLSETSIHEQIEYIFTFFRPEAEQKGLHLKINSKSSFSDPVIITDREKLYAILTNLVKNALKFTREGSIEIGYELKNEYVEFYVRDTGVGVRPEQQEMIFERFRQGSESLARNYEGAGLGLAISKAYVEMLGGKIWVESELGKGSAFYFFLPFRSKTSSESDLNCIPANTGEESGVKNLRILIAEDDPFSAMLLKKALKQYGKDIYVAKTGLEAVDYCRKNSGFDLVLMDIQMPEMNGYEAASKIREFDKKVVIIAQTAFALSGDKEKVIAAGCNDYISKPLKKENLEVLMKKHFENN